MKVSRERLYIGVGIVVVAFEMLGQPPLFISIPLLLFGFFLVAWGAFPNIVDRVVEKLPSRWKASDYLRVVDNFLTESGSQDESLDKLSDMLNEGLRLLNKPVNTEQEFEDWKTEDNNWIDTVYNEIERDFNKSLAVSFQSVVSIQAAEMIPSFNREHNTLKLHLSKRINNLKTLLENQNSNR
jgi:hypothetical protein